jgi:hypothetical protein
MKYFILKMKTRSAGVQYAFDTDIFDLDNENEAI